MSRALTTVALATLACVGCVEVSQWTPPTRLFGGVAVAPLPIDERPFTGITLEESLGSLDEMDFLAGLDVVRVQQGSPGERIGIRAGDRLVAADGVELFNLDQWTAIVDGHAIGESMRLEVERDGGVVEVALELGRVGGDDLPDPLRFVERSKLRVELATVEVDGVTCAEVVRQLRGSPLADRVVVGERIVAMDGEATPGARALIDRVAARDFGEEVRLRVVGASGEREVAVSLWAPRRTLTRLQVPIVFDYAHDPVASVTDFALIDLWLFSVYDYRRELHSRRHRLLYFFEFATGAGELAEVPVEEGR